MKYIILIILLASAWSVRGQAYYQMVQAGSELDKYEKYVKDTLCLNCVFDSKTNKYIPTVYWWVEVNYGFPPPDSEEVLRYILGCGGSTIKGWKLKTKEDANIHGWTEGVYLYTITATNLNAPFYSKTYEYELLYSYGHQDYDLKIIIKSKPKK